MTTALLTDFYEFSMLSAAIKSGKAYEKATFELFARKLPAGRRYGVVAGTGRAIQAVKDFRFTEDQLSYLSKNKAISIETIEYLRNYSFMGRITGYHEGDLYFPNSPILTVEGTFGDSVILETVLLSILNHDSAVAGAASRMVNAANGMNLIEMGSRRTHEIAAVDAARAAYITGFAATSNVEAGLKYEIPITGTSAHAFSLAFADEKEAFKAQVTALGVDTTLLVDTYDINQGIKNAIEVAGPHLGAIRIDSGDLHEETVAARELLDELGAVNTKIVLSSDIDEFTIAELVDRGTPVDGVGAGTRVVTGSGHPTAGMVFKLVERLDENGEMHPVAKKASGKKSIGGLKTAFRTYDLNGKILREFFVTRQSEAINERPNTHRLQYVYADNGMFHIPTIQEAREFHVKALATLPDEAKLTIAGEAAFEAELD